MMNTPQATLSPGSKRYNLRAMRALLTALTVTIIMGTLAPSLALAQDAPKDVVVHLGQYTNDLHSATMGIGLADNLQEAGARVTIFVDREAVRMGDEGHPLLIYGDSDLEALLSSFLEGGGSVLVCPHCAELGGVAADELRSGFTMGTQEAIAKLFMNADIVISY